MKVWGDTYSEQPAPIRLVKAGHYFDGGIRHPLGMVTEADLEHVELVTAGRGWVMHGVEWIEVVPGSLLWHVPGDFSIQRTDFDDPYRCLTVWFETPGLAGRRVPRFTHWGDLDEVSRFTREMVRLFVDGSFERQALCAYCFGRLLFQAELSRYEGRSEGLPRPLAQAVEMIDRAYGQELSIDFIASEVGWSTAYLHEMFKKHLDNSPHQFLIQRRLRAAREFLASTDKSVKEIAADCGFVSASSFCHSFRQAIGQTPTDYRKSQWELLGAGKIK